MPQPINPLPAQEDFLAFALEFLRTPGEPRYGERGCDYYVQSVAYAWCVQQERCLPGEPQGPRENQIAAVAVEAAWELVRRGFLRPGGRSYPDANAADPGRFTLTSRGREWLAVADETHFMVMQPGNLARALGVFQSQFGDGFEQRAQEAIRCREADAWLATCAMSGAAAESILLALAFAKVGDQDAVAREYRTAMGRKKTIDALVGKQPEGLQRPFRSLMGILSYWRDDAAHGMASPISAPEAEEALRQLLMLAQFAARYWRELTT
ncbi:MAG: hypothetical protein ABL982_26335 [Vicinamibacterales bacterium]